MVGGWWSVFGVWLFVALFFGLCVVGFGREGSWTVGVPGKQVLRRGRPEEWSTPKKSTKIRCSKKGFYRCTATDMEALQDDIRSFCVAEVQNAVLKMRCGRGADVLLEHFGPWLS